MHPPTFWPCFHHASEAALDQDQHLGNELGNNTRLTRKFDMNTTDTNTHRALRRLAAIAIVGGLALSFAAAFAALKADADAPGGGIFAWIGDYLTEVSDTIGNQSVSARSSGVGR